MANFFKKFGQGILYVITFPVFVVILAIFAVYGLFLMIIQFFKMIFNFFTGRSVHGELPEDVEARKILNKDNNVQDNNATQEQNSSQEESAATPAPTPAPAPTSTPSPTPTPTPVPTQEPTIESVAFENNNTPVVENNNQPTQENDNVIQDFLSAPEITSTPANNQNIVNNSQNEITEVYRPKTNNDYEIMDDEPDDDFDVTIG